MVFSSVQFIFYFLPVVLGLALVVPQGARNSLLAAASIVFYLWGGGRLVFLLLASIALNYVVGRSCQARRDRGDLRGSLRFVAFAVIANLALLGWFKYANFGVAQLDALLEALGVDPIGLDPIVLPIGISFFTFQGLSYGIDVHRGRTPALRNPIDFALYISFFPQLIAGPIVRYHEVAAQLGKRTMDMDRFAQGALRFSWGLAKKVVVADALAEIAAGSFDVEADQRSFVAAWLGVLAYTLQIYFDFSGYSDMAIGLARLFGFSFPENFNRPYSAYSITDFWRRWHITLSNWFRDYLYIPLGGSRGAGTYRNLVLVFLATGLWHGANWTFVVWGIYHGALLLFERWQGSRHVADAPRPVWSRGRTLLLVAVGWVLFRAQDVSTAFEVYGAMLNPFRDVATDSVGLGLGRRNVVVLVAACVVFALPRTFTMGAFIESSPQRSANLVRAGVMAVVLPYSAMVVVSGSFSPFLYFQF